MGDHLVSLDSGLHYLVLAFKQQFCVFVYFYIHVYCTITL